MKRRMLALATTTVLAGWATAQSPMNLPATNVPAPATGKDAALEPGVVLLRTANQPDRKVKVVKSTKQADGRVITEVMDIKTGETLLVSDKAPGGKTDTASPAMKVPPAVTMPAVAKTPPASAIAMPSTTATSTPVTEKKPATDLPAAKPRDVDPLLNDAKTSTPVSTKTLKTTTTPTSTTPSKSTTTSVAVTPKSPMVIPSTVADKATPAMPMASTATMPPKDNAPIHVVLPAGYVPAEFRMKEETAHDVAALQSASRPSVRQDAATALAEGRYASRMEVKTVLAGAAMHDPAAVVRAHCIQSLSKLGYNTPEYIGYLRQCTVDSSSEVKSAASEALSKLQPKR